MGFLHEICRHFMYKRERGEYVGAPYLLNDFVTLLFVHLSLI